MITDRQLRMALRIARRMRQEYPETARIRDWERIDELIEAIREEAKGGKS